MKHTGTFQHPDRVTAYFRAEWAALLAVTLSGVFYNAGLLAGPWFEGRLAQCLLDIFSGKADFYEMLRLTGAYVAVIAAVQLARYVKRLYVRRFANHVNRNMKQILYGNLVHRSKAELDSEDMGSVMTKAISDVDACAEGMRKFTTEIFDTGVALLGYAALLIWYDWRLALLSLVFPPVSYFLAEKMKVVVQRSGAAAQESRGRLSAATLDRVSSASTYRVFGCEAQRDQAYEEQLADYEKKAVRANIWTAALPPLYQMVSMVSVLFILYLGGKNVMGNGWASWDIAAFTAFLSCFTKLSVKSSKAAKLFNAVQKAEVSWRRIKPLMKPVPEEGASEIPAPAGLEVKNLSVAYRDGAAVFQGLSFAAVPGQIIGVTGPVACGKSTLGRAFLGEASYQGSICFGGEELSTLTAERRWGIVGYLGHDPELMSGTIRDNILLGNDGDPGPLMEAVCMDGEVAAMPEGLETWIGSGGVRLSGGQQARLALARTLGNLRPLLVLDDPFSALDRQTEREVFEHLRMLTRDRIVILISHRLYLFPELDQVIWMENGRTRAGTHGELIASCGQYAALYELQKGGADREENA